MTTQIKHKFQVVQYAIGYLCIIQNMCVSVVESLIKLFSFLKFYLLILGCEGKRGKLIHEKEQTGAELSAGRV